VPTVVIFRERLLDLSETFIHSQVESLTAFKGVYSGCRRVPGLDLSSDVVEILADGIAGRLEEFFLRRLRWAPSIAMRLKKYHPVLLHAHFGCDGITALPIARRLAIPELVTFHGYDANVSESWFLRSRWGRRYLRGKELLKRDVNGFIAISKFVAGKLLEQGFPPDRVQVHYIGVDIGKFTRDRSIQREQVVLFVGRLVEKKGCEYLIKAMEPIQKEMPDTTLVVIGDGPLRATVEEQARAKLKNYCFLGAQSAEVVRYWMSKAMVFCTPSVVARSGDAEGFGIVFIEAQASGLPVVSFSSGGIPEAVAHGETGLLAQEKDWRTLSFYIVELLRSRNAWLRFSSAGRERVRTLFDLSKQTKQLERIYHQLISAGI
jgi:colanic acid/amylovoran biosynthesis glycosyltransferase